MPAEIEKRAAHIEQAESALVPNWYESLYGVDFALLLASPVYYGLGVPRGNASAVVIIPGFMHGDGYLLFMYAWLKRLRYRPYYSRIGFNADCPNILIEDVLNRVVDDARRETGRQVHLIGHSLGGVIARAVAVQRPSDIRSVISLGSPLRQAVVHPTVFKEAEMVRRYVVSRQSSRVRPECLTANCACAFMRSLPKPLPKNVRFTSIYTKHDGLVDWRSCRTGDSAIDVEVPGTHSGMAFNPAAYSVIAERLARCISVD